MADSTTSLHTETLKFYRLCGQLTPKLTNYQPCSKKQSVTCRYEVSEATGLAALVQGELHVLALARRRVNSADGARIHAPRILRRRRHHWEGHGLARSAAPLLHVPWTFNAVV